MMIDQFLPRSDPMSLSDKISKLSHKRFPDPALNVSCTEFEVNNWVISEFILERLVPVVGIKPYPLSELQLMVAAVTRLRPTHVLEWGTHFGVSTRVFYEIRRGFGMNYEIHSVDLPDDVEHVEHPSDKRGKMVKGLEGVKLHQGDGLDVALSIVKGIDAKPLFFLDGDHSYGSVKRELTGIMEQVPEANILLHDTFYQSSGSGYNVGPHQAITEALAERSSNYAVINTTTGLPGMTLLFRSQTRD